MMKFLVLVSALSIALISYGQGDKSKRPSPPDSVTAKTSAGITISINYSKPSVKGRKIGVDLEPMPGRVWRTGANEATVFEVSKDVKVEGKDLPAGKYGLFTIANGDEWTIIFNKTWKQWGAFTYKDADDALRVNVTAKKASAFVEQMKFEISADGVVTLLWGSFKVRFHVQ